MVDIAAIGDNFVRPSLFESALRAEAPSTALSFINTSLPWPHVPFGTISNVHEASGDEASVIEAVGTASIAMTQLAPFTRAVFEACPALEMVGVCRGGPVNVDLEAATEAGVIVSFAPGRNAQAAAEFTVGMMLSAMRRITDGSHALHAGDWRGEYYSYESAGLELAGTTVGIVGLGAIGTIVARILHAFGATVLAHDPLRAGDSTVPEWISLVSLDDLMRRSRVVTLHARLTENSEKMINREMLSLMPQQSVLVNTARGGLLDYRPLADMLDSGHLAALALDVFDQEPPPADWPLLGRENVVVTPHLAGATRETAERAARIVASDVAKFMAGQAPAHIANPEVLDRVGVSGS